MPFEIDKHYTRKTIVKDMEYRGPTTFDVTHFTNIGEEIPYSIITIDTGACHLHVRITPSEARALAANLQAHAMEFEAHQAQYAVEEVAA